MKTNKNKIIKIRKTKNLQKGNRTEPWYCSFQPTLLPAVQPSGDTIAGSAEGSAGGSAAGSATGSAAGSATAH